MKYDEQQNTELLLFIPIKCENCRKTLAYKTPDMTISGGKIQIKCRNCKKMSILQPKNE